MIYLFLATYAEKNSTQAIMVISTFLNDCRSKDFKIKGLALRTLCNLKFPDAYVYIQQAITEALRDTDPYVKRIAIMGIIKLHQYSPQLVASSDFVEILYGLIKDSDSQVVINAITALNEVLEKENGISMTRKLTIYLLNRLKEFNEWGQSVILQQVYKYTPKEEDEMLNMLNIIDERLAQSSASVVLACTKIFLKFTQNSLDVRKQVLERLQSPLITLMASAEANQNYELSYVILTHILALLQKANMQLFCSEYKKFFCKYDEPFYIKEVKLNILVLITSDSNLSEIITEISEYVTDVNSELAKKSINVLTNICLRIKLHEPIINLLRSFLTLNIEYVIEQVIVCLTRILRKYRQYISNFITLIQSCYVHLTTNEAKMSLIWLIGEFGDMVPDAPYILELYIDKCNDLDQSVLYSLLSATMKVFLKRPGETQKMLGYLIYNIYNNSECQDLRSKAMLYYRLLANPEVATQVLINECKCDKFIDIEDDNSSKVLEEFNTLSILYNQPEEKYLNKELVFKKYQQFIENEEKEKEISEKLIVEKVDSPSLIDLDTKDTNNTLKTEEPFKETEGKEVSITLQPNPEWTSAQFKEQWGKIEATELFDIKATHKNATIEETEDQYKKASIFCIASGNMGDSFKLFLYAFDTSNNYYLMELMYDVAQSVSKFKLKCNNSKQVPYMKKYVENVIKAGASLNK